MILKAIINSVGEEKSGVSQMTGKEWHMKQVCFSVDHTTADGRTFSDSFVGDYFGDKSREQLQAFIPKAEKLDFDCWFQTELYNNKRYQRCRINHISQSI